MTCGFCGSEAVLEARPVKSLYRCPCGAIFFVGGTVWSKADHFPDAGKMIELLKAQTKESTDA